MKLLKLAFVCFLFSLSPFTKALNLPEKYQSPHKVEDKESFIQELFNYKELRYKYYEGDKADDPKLWKQIESCETKYEGGSLVLEQYMYNNRPDKNGGLVGLLFHQHGGVTTFIRAEHTLSNYRQKCFVDSGISNGFLSYQGNIEEDHMVYHYLFLKEAKKLYLYIQNARDLAMAGIPDKVATFFTDDQALHISGNSLCSVTDSKKRSYVENGERVYPYCQDSMFKVNGKNKYIAPYIAYEVETGKVHFEHMKDELMKDCGRKVYHKPMSLKANFARSVKYLEREQQLDSEFTSYVSAKCQRKELKPLDLSDPSVQRRLRNSST